jgi:hypothetical protein
MAFEKKAFKSGQPQNQPTRNLSPAHDPAGDHAGQRGDAFKGQIIDGKILRM